MPKWNSIWIFIAAFSLLIPILVHLFKFRKYPTFFFPSLRFVKEFVREKKNRNNLKKWLILASRLFAFGFIAIAFLLSNFNNNDQGKNSTLVSIFIDNSRSMEPHLGFVPLEEAKNQARELIRNQTQNAKFHIITGSSLRSNRILRPQEALQLIDDIELTDESYHLTSIWKQQLAFLKDQSYTQKFIFQFSDFQQGALSSTKNIIVNSEIKSQLIQIQNHAKQNIYIDSVWLKLPYSFAGSKNTLYCKIVGIENELVDPLSVKVERENKGALMAGISLPPNGVKIVAFDIITPSVPEKILIKLEDQGYQFDNEFYALISPTPKLDIYLNNLSAFPEFKRVCETLGFLNATASNQSKTQGSIYFFDGSWGELQKNNISKKLENGETVVLIPTENRSDWNIWQQFENTFGFPAPDKSYKGEEINWSDKEFGNPFYKNIFSEVPSLTKLPSVSSYTATGRRIGAATPIITLANGDPWLVMEKMGKGKLYLFYGNINSKFSSFTSSSLFLPIIGSLFLNDLGFGTTHAYLNSSEHVFSPIIIDNSDISKVRLIKNDNEYIPQITSGINGTHIYIGNYLQNAGFYHLKNSEIETPALALNIAKSESNPLINKSLLDEYANAISAEIIQSKSGIFIPINMYGTKKWKWFIVASFIFILLEIGLIIWPISKLSRKKSIEVKIS